MDMSRESEMPKCQRSNCGVWKRKDPVVSRIFVLQYRQTYSQSLLSHARLPSSYTFYDRENPIGLYCFDDWHSGYGIHPTKWPWFMTLFCDTSPYLLHRGLCYFHFSHKWHRHPSSFVLEVVCLFSNYFEGKYIHWLLLLLLLLLLLFRTTSTSAYACFSFSRFLGRRLELVLLLCDFVPSLSLSRSYP